MFLWIKLRVNKATITWVLIIFVIGIWKYVSERKQIFFGYDLLVKSFRLKVSETFNPNRDIKVSEKPIKTRKHILNPLIFQKHKLNPIIVLEHLLTQIYSL